MEAFVEAVVKATKLYRQETVVYKQLSAIAMFLYSALCLPWVEGGKDPSLVERREALLIFLRGNPKKKDELKAASPTLYQHFERVWSVRQSHMDHIVPAQYAFILTLCYKPECSHPLCHGATREQCWFENGPPLSYIPFPIPDPERPWGGSCEECSGMCSGHYLKPLAHWDYVKDRAYDTAEFQYKPPSAVIKKRFYDSLKQGRNVEHRFGICR